jgi:hypothetical protein
MLPQQAGRLQVRAALLGRGFLRGPAVCLTDDERQRPIDQYMPATGLSPGSPDRSRRTTAGSGHSNRSAGHRLVAWVRHSIAQPTLFIRLLYFSTGA